MKNALILFCLAVFLSGCGGGGATVQQTSVTQGQELVDLKKAMDEGIITKEEYEDAKEKIMDR